LPKATEENNFGRDTDQDTFCGDKKEGDFLYQTSFDKHRGESFGGAHIGQFRQRHRG
jgi:hypothetical protein